AVAQAMTPRPSLKRKVALYMALVALGGLAISVVGWTVLYGLFVEPELNAKGGAWTFHAIDYVGLVVFALCCLALAAGAARSLSRRIVAPVSSVALAARRIASGDLAARVSVDDKSLGEVAGLAEDFNTMANRLQTLDQDAAFWNAAIAHELRTPVTVLRGRLQGVKDGVFKMDERLTTSLLGQVDTLARLVEDLRIVSLAESGYLILQARPVALHDLVREQQAMMGPALREAGFDVNWRPGQAWALGDGPRINQAFLALLENARLHATPGPIICESVAEGDDAVFRVIDSGPGVAEDLRTQIFDRFRRATPESQGSGLGLAVVKAIAEAHGGQARCLSTPDGGSIFEIRLPISISTTVQAAT
ncbi:signal transduction histidine kinase, partial [Caulobacter sp. AP07]|uniref:ATP-binding protein n=1 Tax=Caulobacter sp. AP07 TaxID=1144304 RepID=UPI00027224CA